MAVNSRIAWTTHTWNPWTGCTPISEGCQHCYMERWAKRCGKDRRKVTRCSDRVFRFPLTSRKVKPGDVIFVCSLGDFFHRDVPAAWVEEALDIMGERTDLTFLLLTKRVERMATWCGAIEDATRENAGHIWLGVTAENQKRADWRIPMLLHINWPGKRLVSVEPMLGPISLEDYLPAYVCDGCGRPTPKGQTHEIHYSIEDRFPELCGYGVERCGIDWVIVGGESGPGCRPMELHWARQVLRDCECAGVAFFMKQIGGWPDKRDEMKDFPKDLRIRETPDKDGE